MMFTGFVLIVLQLVLLGAAFLAGAANHEAAQGGLDMVQRVRDLIQDIKNR